MSLGFGDFSLNLVSGRFRAEITGKHAFSVAATVVKNIDLLVNSTTIMPVLDIFNGSVKWICTLVFLKTLQGFRATC